MQRRWSNSVVALARAAAPMPPALGGVAGQPLDGGGQSRRVAHRHEQAGDLVLDGLAAAADVGGHDGHAHGRGLHGGAGEPLPVRGQHVDVHAGVQARHVVARSEEPDAGSLGGRPIRGR